MTTPGSMEARIKRLEETCDQAIKTARDAGVLAIAAHHSPDYRERLAALEADVKQIKDKLGITEIPAYEAMEIPF